MTLRCTPALLLCGTLLLNNAVVFAGESPTVKARLLDARAETALRHKNYEKAIELLNTRRLSSRRSGNSRIAIGGPGTSTSGNIGMPTLISTRLWNSRPNGGPDMLIAQTYTAIGQLNEALLDSERPCV